MNVAHLHITKSGQPIVNNWFPVQRLKTPDGIVYDEVVLGRAVCGRYPLSVWLDTEEPPTVRRPLRRFMTRGVESVKPTFKGTRMYLKAPDAIVSEDILFRDGDFLLGFDTHFGSVDNGLPGRFVMLSGNSYHQMLVLHQASHDAGFDAGFVVIRPGFLARAHTEFFGEQWNLLYPSQEAGLILTQRNVGGQHADMQNMHSAANYARYSQQRF